MPAHRFLQSATAAVGLMLIGAIGCNGPRRETPTPILDDSPMDVVIARINQNSDRMDFLLRAVQGGTATGEYVENGDLVSFQTRAQLLFHKPRNLYLKLEHTLGQKILIGSNDQEFWVWEQLDKKRYYWGRHECLKADDDIDIPLRPDHLLEVLGLGNLPSDTTGPLGPIFRVGARYYELDFLGRDAAGQLYHTKIITIDRLPPFLVRSIVYLHPDGHHLMKAELSSYKNIKGSDVLVPHRILIRWLEDKSWLKLEFSKMDQFDKEIAEQRFSSPLQLEKDVGEIIRVDRPPLSSDLISPPAMQIDKTMER